MKKFRIMSVSLFVALLCMTNAAFARELTQVDSLIAKSRKHHHHHGSDSSSSDSDKRGPRGQCRQNKT